MEDTITEKQKNYSQCYFRPNLCGSINVNAQISSSMFYIGEFIEVSLKYSTNCCVIPKYPTAILLQQLTVHFEDFDEEWRDVKFWGHKVEVLRNSSSNIIILRMQVPKDCDPSADDMYHRNEYKQLININEGCKCCANRKYPIYEQEIADIVRLNKCDFEFSLIIRKEKLDNFQFLNPKLPPEFDNVSNKYPVYVANFNPEYVQLGVAEQKAKLSIIKQNQEVWETDLPKIHEITDSFHKKKNTNESQTQKGNDSYIESGQNEKKESQFRENDNFEDMEPDAFNAVIPYSPRHSQQLKVENQNKCVDSYSFDNTQKEMRMSQYRDDVYVETIQREKHIQNDSKDNGVSGNHYKDVISCSPPKKNPKNMIHCDSVQIIDNQN